MIHVSQGHEKSIGMEVFIKSFLLLSPKEQENFTLVCFKRSLRNTLGSLSISYSIEGPHLKIGRSHLSCVFLPQAKAQGTKTSESTASLLHCLEQLERAKGKGMLLTLPTSKDQLFWKGRRQSGHTELFRSHFGIKSLPMVFLSPHLKVMVITDHLPLAKVPMAITAKLIISKVSFTIEGMLSKLGLSLDEVLLAGINPHCGEGGSIGKEDPKISKALTVLEKKFPQITFKGPIPGDTLFFHRKQGVRQLFVYMYHDQGLGLFKSQNGLLGINVTLGMPYLRMSVDHGTAFDLHGRNQANAMGSLYLLREALYSQSHTFPG